MLYIETDKMFWVFKVIGMQSKILKFWFINVDKYYFKLDKPNKLKLKVLNIRNIWNIIS